MAQQKDLRRTEKWTAVQIWLPPELKRQLDGYLLDKAALAAKVAGVDVELIQPARVRQRSRVVAQAVRDFLDRKGARRG